MPFVTWSRKGHHDVLYDLVRPPGLGGFMTALLAVACAVTFVWLGMVLAISFLEAPLKFRAPEVTLRIGLGIGRLVFGALNTVEAVFAVTLLGCVILVPAAAWIITSVVVTVAILGCSLCWCDRGWLAEQTASSPGHRRHAHAVTTSMSLWRLESA